MSTANIPLIVVEAEEMKEMFLQAGAAEVELFGGYAGQPYEREKSTDIVVVALKG